MFFGSKWRTVETHMFDVLDQKDAWGIHVQEKVRKGKPSKFQFVLAKDYPLDKLQYMSEEAGDAALREMTLDAVAIVEYMSKLNAGTAKVGTFDHNLTVDPVTDTNKDIDDGTTQPNSGLPGPTAR